MKDLDAMRTGVLEVVDGQQARVAVTNPGDLNIKNFHVSSKVMLNA